MSERLLSTGKIVTFLAVALAVTGLGWVLAGQLAKPTEAAGACTPEPGLFRSFDAAGGGTPVPDTPFDVSGGKTRTLADYKGTGLVVNFWATWCAPCVKEMPQLNRLNALLKGSAIEVLTISEDRKGIPLAKKFFEVNKLHDLDVLADPKGALMRKFAVKGLPTTILIDTDGREAGRVTGAAEWDTPDVVGFLKRCLRPKRD